MVMTPDERQRLIDECARIFGVHPRDLAGSSRFGFLMLARFALYKAMYQRCAYYTDVSHALNKDRKSVWNGVQRAERRMASDPDYAAKVAHLVAFRTYTPKDPTDD